MAAYADGRLYWIVKFFVTPFVRVFVRVRVEGRENVPDAGAVILAANHRSFLDSIFIPLVVRRRVTFVAKAEYFDDAKTAWFFRSCGQIPIRREGGSASERALASATEVLRAGKVFGIYPEGTRTRDGMLHRGHTGVARLALRLQRADRADRAHRHRRRAADRLSHAEAVPAGDDPVRRTDRPGRYAGREHDRMALRELTDEVMYEIASCRATSTSTRTRRSRPRTSPPTPRDIASFADARNSDLGRVVAVRRAQSRDSLRPVARARPRRAGPRSLRAPSSARG